MDAVKQYDNKEIEVFDFITLQRVEKTYLISFNYFLFFSSIDKRKIRGCNSK